MRDTLAVLFVGGGLLFASTPAGAQQGSITGSVRDAESLRPVSGAQVFIAGTVVGDLTGERGAFRLEDVPAGTVSVSVRLIGYRDLSQTAEVRAGETTTVDLLVEQTALALQEIVVTGLVGETPRVKLPFTVERLGADELPIPAADVSSLLAGKAPGVRAVSGSGQPGVASDILLRGPTSIDASGRSQAPLIVIDGVIQSESASLADVGSLDIDHVEIVKGAAAASLYGSRAQSGVIQITTKRGTSLPNDAPSFLVRGEYGTSSLEGSIELAGAHPYLMNSDGTKFIDFEGNEVSYDELTGAGSTVLKDGGTPATAFADNPWPRTFDHLDRFFDPGESYSVYGALATSFGESSFRLSAEQFRESGIVSCDVCEANLETFQAERIAQGLGPLTSAELPENRGYERQNVRLNVDTRFGALQMAASGFHSRSWRDDAGVEDNAFFDLTFMSPAVDLTELDPRTGLPRFDVDPLDIALNPLYIVAIGEHVDERDRTMGSLDVRWTPVEWLYFEGNASYDRTDLEELDYLPKTTLGRDDQFTGGSLEQFEFGDEATNVSVTAGVVRRLLNDELTVRARARYLVEDQSYRSSGVFGQRFSVEGVTNFGAIEGATSASNEARRIRSEGYYGIVSLDYAGRYILDGLVRRDGSSLFGPEERWHTYVRGSAAWRPSQEDWWDVGAIDEWKLRFSYGTAGGRPNFYAQYETYGVSGGGLFPINLGNRDLKPEHTVEREAGTNLVILDRLGIDYTYAWATTSDQLLQVPQPAYVGFSTQWVNAAELDSHTHELSLHWAAIDTDRSGLDLRFTWDRTRQRITAFNPPPYRTGPNGIYFIAAGRPVGEIWGSRWAESCADLAGIGITTGDCGSSFRVNSDGLLVWTGGTEVDQGIAQGLWGSSGAVGGESFHWGMPIEALAPSPVCLAARQDEPDACPPQASVPIGDTSPEWNASLATNVRHGALTFHVLLDASVGWDIYNWPRQWALRSNDGADISQIGKAEGDKKPVLYYANLYNVNEANSFFVERGDWLKVRELSLSYTVPGSLLASLLGGSLDRVTLTLIGRNLLTFTDYRGYDPEVGLSGRDFGSAVLGQVDLFQYPNFRTITAAVEIAF